MPNPEEQTSQEVHEGTKALQDIAEEVEAERSKSGPDLTVPDDDTPEDDGETREDHQAEAGDPLNSDNIPPGVFIATEQTGGANKP